MEPATSETGTPPRSRVNRALRARQNWEQLFKFCVVGASGYTVNLAVYAVLVRRAHIHYIPAAAASFAVAVANNYTWNRLWTFSHQRGHVAYQGLRFLVVSLVTLAANIALLRLFVHVGLDKIAAQAIAVVLVTPLNFVGNKLWSFRRH